MSIICATNNTNIISQLALLKESGKLKIKAAFRARPICLISVLFLLSIYLSIYYFSKYSKRVFVSDNYAIWTGSQYWSLSVLSCTFAPVQCQRPEFDTKYHILHDFGTSNTFKEKYCDHFKDLRELKLLTNDM